MSENFIYFCVPITNDSVLWEVYVDETDQIEYGQKVIKLRWGSHDETIKMTLKQAKDLKGRLNKVIKKLSA